MFSAIGNILWLNSNMGIHNLNSNGKINVQHNNIVDKIPFSKQIQLLKNKETGDIIRLKKPITFEIDVDEDGIYYSNSEYNIYASGVTQKDVEDSLFEEFMFIYNSYAKESDNNLDENAKKLKYKLLRIYGDNNV